MNENKQDLKSLIAFVTDIANQEGNEWFKKEIGDKLGHQVYPKEINEIYEYCIQQILKDQSTKFYSDFKLNLIKDKLIEDYIRMEKFKRDDNFEDFCLATYQQLELITNELIQSTDFIEFIKHKKNDPAIYKYDINIGDYIPKGTYTIGKLIFSTSDQILLNKYLNSPVQNWFFNHKFRAVLYFFYFNKQIKTNTDHFDRVYEIGNFLYQGRNLNHRGGAQSQYQKEILDNMIPNQHKYYFKFLGFLEDFITTINKNI